jgi:hypothetical protein
MNKLSSQQVQQVLSEVPGTLRKLAAERDHWRKEAEMRMRRDEAEKVAHEMHNKGINADVSIDRLVESLEKAAESGTLGDIARAVDMVGPDMSEKIASLTSNTDVNAHSGISGFERYILGGIG